MDSLGVGVICDNKVHNNTKNIVIEYHTGTYKIVTKPVSFEWTI